MGKNDYCWSDSLDVGNSKLNEEHKDLLSKMACVERLNTKTFSKDALLEAYDDLLDFTAIHFREEEDHLEKIAYPNILTHKRIHKSLLDALTRYRREFTGSVNGRFPSSVFDYFKTWILTHIMIVDRQYFEFEKAQKVARE